MICGINQIRHLVVSGGVVYGISFYGCLKQLEIEGMWNINNIKSIYCTSIGSVVSVLLSVTQDWDVLDNYLINRPWNELYKTNFSSFIDSYTNCGIFGFYIIEETLKPVLKSKDIDIDITMKSFYELTNIDLHIFSTQYEGLTEIDISYKTHPEWKLTEAVYASCCFPFLFKPFVKDSKTYIDGGLVNNYPMNKCIENSIKLKDEQDSILGVSILRTDNNNTINPEFETVFTYIINIIYKLLNKCNPKPIPIKNEIIIKSSLGPSFNLYEVLKSKEQRKKFVDHGKQCADMFIQENKKSLAEINDLTEPSEPSEPTIFDTAP